MLTNTPGRELYRLFGHSALRLKDPQNNIDIVFNYGTFDFNTSHFYLKFIRGNLKYFLSVYPFKYYKADIDPFQTVYSQELNLDFGQRKKLLQFLINNYKPDNRYYLYDFFYDNCSTRIRDALKESLGSEVSFEYFQPQERKSFRELLHPYIKPLPWADLGVNLALGLPADSIAKARQYMFLPDYLMDAFAVASVEEEGKMRPLVKETEVIAEGSHTTEIKSGTFLIPAPSVIFWILFLIIALVSLFEMRSKAHFLNIDKFFFGLFGLFGVFLLFLWKGTAHEVMEKNLNLLWAIPLHLPIILLIGKKVFYKIKWLHRFYFTLTLIVTGLFVVSYKLLPQGIHVAVIPLALILVVRSLKLVMKAKKE